MKKSNNTLFKDIRSHEIRDRGRIVSVFQGRYTILDIETTGMNSDITEIAAIHVKGGEIEETFHSLIHPKGLLERRVVALTGITCDMLTGKPVIAEMMPLFLKFIEGRTLMGHGLDSDLIVLDRNLRAMGRSLITNSYIDTNTLAHVVLPETEGESRKYSVQALCEYYELPCTSFHRAMDDCLAEKMLFEKLMGEWMGKV